MAWNYLILFVRNIRRQQLFAGINLLGLTTSVVCTLMIFLYVSFELSYDNFHPAGDRLYRVNQTFIWAENSDSQFSRTGPGVATALQTALPEIEMITSLHTPGNFIFTYSTPGDEVISFEEDKVLAADSNFFKVFNFPLVNGQPEHAFTRANTLMLTESAARRYFNDENPIGKLLLLNASDGKGLQPFEVTGVLKDVPANSTIEFDVLLSMKNFPVEKLHWSWIWTQLETFVVLRRDADMNNVMAKLADIPRLYSGETMTRVMNTTYEEYIASGKKWELFLQPVDKLHLPEVPVSGSFPDTGNLKVIVSLIGAAIFILLLSCINFANLSSAQFSRRIKEASIRNILGLGKRSLIVGYFVEALAFSFVAFIVGLALTQLFLPLFNTLTGKQLTLALLGSPLAWLCIAALMLAMAAICSLYPALFFTSFSPAEGIKGRSKSRGGRHFRNALVVFQFAVSILLIISTGVVFQQLNYIANKDLGFDKSNLVEIRHLELLNDYDGIRKSMTSIPGVVSGSIASSVPPRVFGGDSFTSEGLNGTNFQLTYTSADEEFIPTLEIRLKYGRNFSNNPADRDKIVVNEATLRKLGWEGEEAIGKRVHFANDPAVTFEIVGVVSDFNYWSLNTSIDPMAIFHVQNENVFGTGKARSLVVRLDGNSAVFEQTLKSIRSAWKRHAGDAPFDYEFVDDTYAQTFATHQKFGNVLAVMSGLAILIASLGVFGMIVYVLETRTKEIGIRKVSGASAFDIMMLVNSSYSKLVAIAFLVAAPVAYYVMQQWLSDFAFRVTPSWAIFLAAAIGLFLLTIMITTYHTFKAALTNPVDVLRNE